MMLEEGKHCRRKESKSSPIILKRMLQAVDVDGLVSTAKERMFSKQVHGDAVKRALKPFNYPWPIAEEDFEFSERDC